MSGSNQERELERLEAEFRSLLALAEHLDVVPKEAAASGRVRGLPLSWITDAVVRRLADNARGKLSLISSMLDGARRVVQEGKDASVLMRRLPGDLFRMEGYLACVSDVRSQNSAIGNKAKKARAAAWHAQVRAAYTDPAKKWQSKKHAAWQIAQKLGKDPDTVLRFLYKEFPEPKAKGVAV